MVKVVSSMVKAVCSRNEKRLTSVLIRPLKRPYHLTKWGWVDMRLVMSLVRDSRCPAEMVIIEDPFFLPSCSWKTRLTTGFPASCIIVITASFTGSWREAREMRIETDHRGAPVHTGWNLEFFLSIIFALICLG